MKTRTFISTIASSFFIFHSVFGQGALTPPGSPAPTMKSLGQVEPRVPISSLPFTISRPGSYYVTTNLALASGIGIVIEASDVTLDLMGFELAGGTGGGIFVNNLHTNITIRNGTVQGWASVGIDLSNGRNVRLVELLASDNADGIWVNDAANISHCSAWSNALVGIRAGRGSRVEDCVVRNNGRTGIALYNYTTVESCIATANGGNGIEGGIVCNVRNCTSALNGGDGIHVGETAQVENCLVNANGTNGIYASGQSVVENNSVDYHFTSGAGIWMDGNGSRIERNHISRVNIGLQVSDNSNYVVRNSVWQTSYGLKVDGIGNLIFGNAVSSGFVDYKIAATNRVGVIVTPPESGAISGSTGGTGMGTTDPWANFSY